MAEGRSVTTISDTDYDAIEHAVMETERGRWFLREYARRNRNADTQVLLDAIGRLEHAVAGDRVAQDVERLRMHLREMATAITRTKAEIATIHAVEQEHSRLFEASEALDAITRTTEQATSDILAAAEHIQEAAWTLREDGADPQLCSELDRRATEIYTACSFQDITAQRIAKIIQTLRYLEGRINSMIALWDAAEGTVVAAAPIIDGSRDAVDIDLTQSDIDSVIVDGDLFEAPNAPAEDLDEDAASEELRTRSMQAAEQEVPEEAPELPSLVVSPAPAVARMRSEAFAGIDALPTRDKLLRFT